jgi:hypothetical protein
MSFCNVRITKEKFCKSPSYVGADLPVEEAFKNLDGQGGKITTDGTD